MSLVLLPFDQKNLPSQYVHWGNMQGAAASLAICSLAVQRTSPIIVLTIDNLTSQRLAAEIEFFLSGNNDINLVHFPDRETLPYDIFSPHQDIVSNRLFTLYQLQTATPGITLMSIATAMHYLLPRDYLMLNSFALSIGDQLVPDEFFSRLVDSGYRRVGQVMEHGEFTTRGSIIDVFPMGAENPYRIDLFGNDVDSIRLFDPDTQRTINKIDQIRLLPAREYPLTEAAITHFRQQWRSHFPGNPTLSATYEAISQGKPIPGVEYYLPLFYPDLNTIFEYLPANSQLVFVDDVHSASLQFQQEVNARYTARAIDHTQPILKPDRLFLASNHFFEKTKQFNRIQLTEKTVETFNFACQTPPELPIKRQEKKPLANLEEYIAQNDKRILFTAESSGRREVLTELLATINITPKVFNSWYEFLQDTSQFGLTVAPIERGLALNKPLLEIITEGQIFGLQVAQTRRRKSSKEQEFTTIVRDMMELQIGTPIVHIDHGIGKYAGLQLLEIGDEQGEYLTIEYAGNDKLYVPVSSLHLINRYSGPDAEHIALSKLGTDQWTKAKRKASEKIKDVAAELLAIYAKRAAKTGYAFHKLDGDYASFASAFPFETTPDQESAITDVFVDMQKKQPMDRLVCGDVGFGKTEVAMRAAFLAVMNNKQVAVLVPTTLLAQQHYQTFCDRFADWPITIEMLSRFKTTTQANHIEQQLANKKIDIIIGTHRLLQKDINFNDLGLLILDEEHRFGVKQKDRLKSLRAEIDILTLTATPIPRTLNLSIAGVRDLSIIATPPEKRLSIKTFVLEHNKEMLREAILREIMRGGQVYYLHNNVQTIERTTELLQELIPEITAKVAHGQMRERELEKAMTDFYHHRFNVLVCTTIIESGIDIPTANTIIIDRADRFGLAQLHQLRGRVGRSHHQAYAYLIIPNKKLITKDAIKRLEAISALEDLGAGFMLATHDLEIRGAGEILGEEQSGHMQAIGFSLYMELLERAVKTIKAGKEFDIDAEDESNIDVEISIPAFIPDDYVPDVHTRLILYKRIANAKTESELTDLQVELIDRFGLLPDKVKNLFKITEIKLRSKEIGLKKLKVSPKQITMTFLPQPKIEPDIIIELIQNQPDQFSMAGANKLRINLDDTADASVIEQVNTVFDILENK